MANKKILQVYRDLMGAKVGLPIAKGLIESGIDMSTIAEGRAVGVCEENHFSMLYKGNDEQKSFGDPSVKAQLFAEEKPDALMIGCSSPTNWELELAEAAQGLGVPIIAVSDIWGALKRLSGITVDLALVIDEHEATRVTYKLWVQRQPTMPHVKTAVVIGDYASATNVSIPDSQKDLEERLMKTVSERETILIVGDRNENIIELVEMVAMSVKMEKNPDDYVIIPRLLHPKFLAPGAEVPAAVKKILEDVNLLLTGLNVDSFDRTTDGKLVRLGTDAIAARAKYTVTAFSTPLRIAIHNGRRGVSVGGPISKMYMGEETSFSTYPLVDSNVVPELRAPTPFSAIGWEHLDLTARKWAEGAKFFPELGVQAIKEMLGIS